MSAAEFVRNVGANTSVYRWEATGLEELTRQNKLTTLPFWIPNTSKRQHQFKLVLLRGLVPSADPANDPFGVLVELIPPPPPPTVASEAGRMARSPEFPGGCAVTCAVLRLDAPHSSDDSVPVEEAHAAHDRAYTATKTAVIDANNEQVSFPDLIPAEILHNPHYVSGTPKSITLQVTIETGISVPLHQVATTAYSFFSTLSSSVSHLLGNTAQLVHEGRENLNLILTNASAAASGPAGTGFSAPGNAATAADTSATGASAAASTPPPPWERPPVEWSSRPEAWRSLISVRLAGLDGTYRHGVEKTLCPDEVALLAEVGLSESDLWSLYALFDFDRDVQEGLLTSAVVRARRYALVPARIKEELFWANFFWKAHCVGQCVTERQVSAVIATLCTPARASDIDLSSSVEEVLKSLSDGSEIMGVLRDFLQRNEAAEPWCAVVAETARHCVTVLHISSQRVDLALHTTEQLQRTLADLRETLASYGRALSSPPPTPISAALPADDADDVAEVAAAPATADDEPQNATTGVAPALSAAAVPDEAAPPEETAAVAVAAEPAPLQPESRDARSPSPPVAASAAPPSPPADQPANKAVPAPAEEARSASRVQFERMPWEEEDD